MLILLLAAGFLEVYLSPPHCLSLQRSARRYFSSEAAHGDSFQQILLKHLAQIEDYEFAAHHRGEPF